MNTRRFIHSIPSPLRPRRTANVLIIALVTAGLLAGCGETIPSDAFGNFEATEITVSSESAGRLLRLDVSEGDRLDPDEVVGLVDTTRLAIRRRSLMSGRRSALAGRRASEAQQPEIDARIETLRARLRPAEKDLARTQRLLDGGAATERELEQSQSEVDALSHQIEQARAQKETVAAQTESLDARVEEIGARLREIEEELADARVTNPVGGIVLTAIAHAGETVAAGSPLYTIADLDTLDLKAYATGDQLPRLRLGSTVEVIFDGEEGELRRTSGILSWIADRAQFTPTPVQTRENRADLVYAFEVRVPNPEGLLKIGMPGEVRFGTPSSAAEE